jgi:hypothetical protein
MGLNMNADETALLREIGHTLEGVPANTILTVLAELMAATIAYGAEDIAEADGVVGRLDARLKAAVRANWDALRRVRFENTCAGRA